MAASQQLCTHAAAGRGAQAGGKRGNQGATRGCKTKHCPASSIPLPSDLGLGLSAHASSALTVVPALLVRPHAVAVFAPQPGNRRGAGTRLAHGGHLDLAHRLLPGAGVGCHTEEGEGVVGGDGAGGEGEGRGVRLHSEMETQTSFDQVLATGAGYWSRRATRDESRRGARVLEEKVSRWRPTPGELLSIGLSGNFGVGCGRRLQLRVIRARLRVLRVCVRVGIASRIYAGDNKAGEK